MKNYLILTIISYLVNYSNTASKYYDGPIIPYNFGFAIAGYQHRHEEKDEKGQIMGEYGFVTGDGVYHSTGYGTDENGNYKILFMRNIKIGLPGEPGSLAAPQNIQEQVVTLTPIAEQKPDISTSTTKLIPITKPNINIQIKEVIPSAIYSCSNCVIPEIEKPVPVTKQPKPQLLPASFINPDKKSIEKTTIPENQSKKKNGIQEGQFLQRELIRPITNTAITIPKTPTISSKIPSTNSLNGKGKEAVGLDVRVNGNLPSDDISGVRIKSVSQIQPPSVSKGTIQTQIKQDRVREQFSQDKISKGTVLSPGSKNKISGKSGKSLGSPDIRSSLTAIISPPSISGRPVQTDGTIKPSSLSAEKISTNGVHAAVRQKLTSGILYKFNYTAGYHGHHEQGDHVGAKDGGYYIVGRDGYRRTVDYNANELGFQPHVKLEQAAPQDIPREETEKEAGLKGYEFKWFNI